MLLCVDVGNTNIVFGLYRGDELAGHWRVSTDHQKMPDEYAVLVANLLELGGFGTADVADAIVASVVPPITDMLTEMLKSHFGLDPLVVGSGIKTGVSIRVDNPREVGADRIVNVAAAFPVYGGPACVIDFGTATTFDAMSAKGEYLGGAIAPGILIAAEALFMRTAKLPRIDLQRPPAAIGCNTVDSMRSGVLFGYVSLVEGMVARFRRELGPEMRVIATGGLGRVIAQETTVIEHVDPWLTLKGLKLIYQLNRGRS
jgi:type III pantothenate kinase